MVGRPSALPHTLSAARSAARLKQACKRPHRPIRFSGGLRAPACRHSAQPHLTSTPSCLQTAPQVAVQQLAGACQQLNRFRGDHVANAGWHSDGAIKHKVGIPVGEGGGVGCAVMVRACGVDVEEAGVSQWQWHICCRQVPSVHRAGWRQWLTEAGSVAVPCRVRLWSGEHGSPAWQPSRRRRDGQSKQLLTAQHVPSNGHEA